MVGFFLFWGIDSGIGTTFTQSVYRYVCYKDIIIVAFKTICAEKEACIYDGSTAAYGLCYFALHFDEPVFGTPGGFLPF